MSAAASTLRGDLGVLLRLLRGMPRGATHAQSLDAFYAAQSGDYDRFRERLLRGRAELVAALPLPPRARIVELGGGTGRNVEFLGARLADVASYTVVDLCEPLLARARERAKAIPQLHAVHGDATRWQPDALVDAVILSYALTMIPDWRAALANACAMLKPGGVLGVVDFYVSPRRADVGMTQHGAFTRAFWPRWFAHDGVHPNADHLPALRALLPQNACVEARAPVPYLPLARVPYYRFLGRKA